MKISASFIALVLPLLASAKLILDYEGSQPASNLGNVELESFNLGDKVTPARGGNNVYIRPETDPATGLAALHFHREPRYRRAEVKSLSNKIQQDKTYYIGYHLRLEKSGDNLVIFQWKKHDKAAYPMQNIPLHLEYEGSALTLGYTTPGFNNKPEKRAPYWRGSFTPGQQHHVGMVINTANNGSGYLEFYLDGEKQTFFDGSQRLENIHLFTGPTSPKFGIYRAEAAGNARYDSYVYRVMISDSGFDEIKAAAGV